MLLINFPNNDLLISMVVSFPAEFEEETLNYQLNHIHSLLRQKRESTYYHIQILQGSIF